VSRKAVFDAMVFLQAAANRAGPSGACLDHARSGSINLITSPETVAELRGLLARPNIREKFPRLTDEVAEVFVREVERTSTSIDEVPRVFEYPRDPKDEPYVNLAIAAQADDLTSRDRDLLDLMQDPDFVARLPAIRVLDPVSLLREIEAEGRQSMTSPEADQRSPERRARDEQIAAESALASPELSPDAVPSPVEAHARRVRPRFVDVDVAPPVPGDSHPTELPPGSP
jgi:putative PIN family toxin of toxin-antitoxin system